MTLMSDDDGYTFKLDTAIMYVVAKSS
jgi:hypothetical protein